MRATLSSRGSFLFLLAFTFLLPASILRAAPPEIKLEVQLIWATNAEKSPDPKHKPVSDAIRKKLLESPMRWTNYFVVKEAKMKLPPAGADKTSLSEKCSVEVKDLGKSMFEISLYGKGQKVLKQSQALPRDETLVLGGNDRNETAWFVVLKRTE
jgi:hypothetical protein